jgi:hypothetical protein
LTDRWEYFSHNLHPVDIRDNLFRMINNQVIGLGLTHWVLTYVGVRIAAEWRWAKPTSGLGVAPDLYKPKPKRAVDGLSSECGSVPGQIEVPYTVGQPPCYRDIRITYLYTFLHPVFLLGILELS